MKTKCNLMQFFVTYDISDISSDVFRRMRASAIKELVNQMVDHYEFPSADQRVIRNEYRQLVEGLGNEIWSSEENVKDAVKGFKRAARFEAKSGHMRGGKWRAAK